MLSSLTDGLGKIKESTLKQELTNYFGEEGTDFTLEGSRFDGWEVTVLKDKVTYLVEETGGIKELECEEPIDNSESLVLGLVDDLGTRSTIYLYGNSDKIQEGNITVTLTDYPEGSITGQSLTQSITATSDNTSIEDSANYKTYTVSKNGTYTFKVTSGGNETETKIKVKNIEKFKKVDDLKLSYSNSEKKAYNYDGASIPKGYYVDTKSKIDTGLVITDDIDEEGYSTGNEWVWVPVNSTVGNNDFYYEGTGMVAGTSNVTFSKYSKLFDFVTNPTTGKTTRTVKLEVKSSERSGYKEPAVATRDENYVSYIYKRGTTNGFESIDDVAEQYVKDYNNMVTSVNRYRGFYIGRYELTSSGEKPGNPVNNKNWYWYYNQCMTLEKENSESGMIYGTLWDATMDWLAKSGYSVGYTGNTTSGYGVYFDEEVKIESNKQQTTIIVKASGVNYGLKTGQTSYTRSNNIYDLAGNMIERTQESFGDYTRTFRSGSFRDTSNQYTYAASRFDVIPTDASNRTATRPQLYIK